MSEMFKESGATRARRSRSWRRRSTSSRSSERPRRSRRGKSPRRSRNPSGSYSRSPDFHRAPDADMDGSRAQRRAARSPGLTLKEGLAGMAKYLSRCVGGKTLGEWDPRVTQYLTTVVEKGGRDLGLRNRRELRTLAEALDHMLEGTYLQAADILMARFTSVELASQEQSWAVSQHLELIPNASSGAASESAKWAAAKGELTQAKLRRTLAGGGSSRDFHQRRRNPQHE